MYFCNGLQHYKTARIAFHTYNYIIKYNWNCYCFNIFDIVVIVGSY